MFRHRRQARRPWLERLDDRCLLSGLTPAQLSHAYGLDAVTFTNSSGRAVKGDGSGQTIAVVVAYHDPYINSDLKAYDRTYGLADPTINVVNLAGASSDSGWAQEESLDVETAHAMAPGAKILVVEAASDSIDDLVRAVDVARSTAGVSVVSMSWGAGEFYGQNSYDAHFTTPVGHTGVTFVAASGDEGSRGGAEWPASSPSVLAVGGTTLRVAANGTYQSESLWSSSSGGTSRYEPEPAYQRTVQSSGARQTPDVSFDGDPATGVSVYTTDPYSGRGSWVTFGGTSLGTPAWAGIVAVADQGRALVGKGTLDSATQTMNALYSLPSTDFHKVASLTTSSFSYGFWGRFRSTQTTVTAGLGTPNGPSLVRDLVAYGVGTARVGTRAVTATTMTSTPVRTAVVASPAMIALLPATSATTAGASLTGPALPTLGQKLSRVHDLLDLAIDRLDLSLVV